jgi:hypothetical protein
MRSNWSPAHHFLPAATADLDLRHSPANSYQSVHLHFRANSNAPLPAGAMLPQTRYQILGRPWSTRRAPTYLVREIIFMVRCSPVKNQDLFIAKGFHRIELCRLHGRPHAKNQPDGHTYSNA